MLKGRTGRGRCGVVKASAAARRRAPQGTCVRARRARRLPSAVHGSAQPRAPAPAPARTLTTAGAQCLDKFNALIKANYKGDATCADLIRTAMSTADPAKCPKGSADPKSDVQACLAKDAVRLS